MGTNEVDAALAAGPAEVGARVLALAEDQWFDRKGAAIAPKDLAVVLVAFANAEGGIVVVGASNGRVRGLAGARKKLNELRQASVNFTVPPVRVHVREVDCVDEDRAPDILLVVHVDVGERVHELTNGECYLRVGDSSHKLSYVQRQELDFDKGQAQYDGYTAAGVTLDDLDTGLVNNYRSRTGATASTEALLGARGLLDRAGGLTNGAYLLFGQHPQDLFPQAYVRVLRFLTRERGTGARLGLDDAADIRIEGPIPHVIQRARREIEKLLPHRRALSPTSGRFEPIPIIPPTPGSGPGQRRRAPLLQPGRRPHPRRDLPRPPRDRVPRPVPGAGRPDPPVADQPLRPQPPHRPRLRRPAHRTRTGRGHQTHLRGDASRRIVRPDYRQTGGSVRLTLAAIARLDPALARQLPRGSQAILDALRAAGTPLGTGDISDLAGLSRPATQQRLRALAEHNLIRWNGKSPKDPRAVWELAD